MTSDIRIDRVSVHFPAAAGTVEAVDDVSITFRAGEITGIIGESGCGKSVLGMAILGLLPSYAVKSGAVWYQGEDLFGLPPKRMRQLRGRELGLIAQSPADSLNPVRRIKGQLTEAIKLRRDIPGTGQSWRTGKNMRLPQQRESAWQTSTANRHARELLLGFGFLRERVDAVLNSYPFQLSGGMQQRIVAVMGIASGARWILADEPSKGLDPRLREQLYDNLRQLREQEVDGMMIITHDIDLAKNLCDSVAVMYSGRIVEKGRRVLEAPRHPYTRGLLASLPSAGMHAMAGMAPAPGDKPEGCCFAPRCSDAQPECHRHSPDEYGDADEMVRCFLYA